MNKQPKATEKPKNSIVYVFCEMYETIPIEKIYVKDVIKRVGYNRSTFYQYFEDIYSLRDYIEDDILKTIHTRIEEFHIYATLSLFRLWISRGKDISQQE